MKELKVSFDVAKNEVENFVESSGIEIEVDFDSIESYKNKKEDAEKDDLRTIKKIIKNLCLGSIVIVDEQIKLNLKYPITKGTPTNELVWSNRLTVEQQNKCLNQFKPDDSDGRLLAVTAARTGQNTGVIKALDMVDYNKAAIITSLFL